MTKKKVVGWERKVLNLYAGIGGNRKLWKNVDVTAVENNEDVAKIYRDFFPKDKVVIADAHQYLLDYYKEFNFIWSSPPCPTHSRLRAGFSVANGAKAVYPDMKLYEEVLFLDHFFKGNYCVENVMSWYDPLVPPQVISRHYYWANFLISKRFVGKGKINLTGGWEKQNDKEQVKQLEEEFGFDLSGYKIGWAKKRRLLRNCVEPETGLHILKCAFPDEVKLPKYFIKQESLI